MEVTHIGVADGKVRYSSGDFKNQLNRFKDPKQDWFRLPNEMHRLDACEYILKTYKERLSTESVSAINNALHYHYIRYKTKLNKENHGKTQPLSV